MSVRQVKDGRDMPEVPKNVPYVSLTVSPMSSLKRSRRALAAYVKDGRAALADRLFVACPGSYSGPKETKRQNGSVKNHAQDRSGPACCAKFCRL